MIGKYVLIYQKWRGELEPKPPFVGKITADYRLHWGVEYELLDNSVVFRKVNKACCSTHPVKSPNLFQIENTEVESGNASKTEENAPKSEENAEKPAEMEQNHVKTRQKLPILDEKSSKNAPKTELKIRPRG